MYCFFWWWLKNFFLKWIMFLVSFMYFSLVSVLLRLGSLFIEFIIECLVLLLFMGGFVLFFVNLSFLLWIWEYILFFIVRVDEYVYFILEFLFDFFMFFFLLLFELLEFLDFIFSLVCILGSFFVFFGFFFFLLLELDFFFFLFLFSFFLVFLFMIGLSFLRWIMVLWFFLWNCYNCFCFFSFWFLGVLIINFWIFRWVMECERFVCRMFGSFGNCGVFIEFIVLFMVLLFLFKVGLVKFCFFSFFVKIKFILFIVWLEYIDICIYWFRVWFKNV